MAKDLRLPRADDLATHSAIEIVMNQPFDSKLRPITVACALAAVLTTTGIGFFIDMLAKPAGAAEAAHQASAAPVTSVR